MDKDRKKPYEPQASFVKVSLKPKDGTITIPGDDTSMTENNPAVIEGDPTGAYLDWYSPGFYVFYTHMPFKYIFFHLEPLNEGGLLTCPESKATGEPLQDNGNYKISISIIGFIDDSSYNISIMFIYNLLCNLSWYRRDYPAHC